MLGQHYEVDQRLRMTAVLKGGREGDRDGQEVRESFSQSKQGSNTKWRQDSESTFYSACFTSVYLLFIPPIITKTFVWFCWEECEH